MYPSKHLALGVIFSLIAYAIFPSMGLIGILLIILSTFFIDVDHYFCYVLKKRDLNLRNAYLWFDKKQKMWKNFSPSERRKYKREILIFHGVEAWIFLAIFSFLFNPSIFLLIGVIFHIFLDYVNLIYLRDPFYFEFSTLLTFIKNKNRIYLHL